MTGEQATLGGVSATEGGGGVDAEGKPRGSEPKTAYPYPDIGDRIAALDGGGGRPPPTFEELNEGPNLAAGPWACDTCGGASEECYRCSECEADLVGSGGSGTSTRHGGH